MKFIRMMNKNGLNDAVVNLHLLTGFTKETPGEQIAIFYHTVDGGRYIEYFTSAYKRDAQFEAVCAMLEVK